MTLNYIKKKSFNFRMQQDNLNSTMASTTVGNQSEKRKTVCNYCQLNKYFYGRSTAADQLCRVKCTCGRDKQSRHAAANLRSTSFKKKIIEKKLEIKCRLDSIKATMPKSNKLQKLSNQLYNVDESIFQTSYMNLHSDSNGFSQLGQLRIWFI